MKVIIGVVLGIVTLVAAPIAVLDYLDERYLLKRSHPVLIGLPVGTIMPWYSKDGVVPSGWAICDGSKGTPDLRSKFLRGGSSLGDVGSTGGMEKFTIPGSTLTVYASGWDGHLTKSPNGGPHQNQSWGNKRWHRLRSKGQIPKIEFETAPPYVTVLFIMKLGPAS